MTLRIFNRRFDIDGRAVGEGLRVYIIAEAGVAHFGSEEKAYRLVDLAADAGADAVKFQVFDVDAMISKDSQEWRARLGYAATPVRRIRTHPEILRQEGSHIFRHGP